VTRTIVADSGIAPTFSGIEGAARVVVDTTLDQGEEPFESYERTLYQYVVPARRP
jgi:hypothetical protein